AEFSRCTRRRRLQLRVRFDVLGDAVEKPADLVAQSELAEPAKTMRQERFHGGPRGSAIIYHQRQLTATEQPVESGHQPLQLGVLVVMRREQQPLLQEQRLLERIGQTVEQGLGALDRNLGKGLAKSRGELQGGAKDTRLGLLRRRPLSR